MDTQMLPGPDSQLSSAFDTYPYFLAFYLIITVLFRDILPKPSGISKSSDPWAFHKYIDIVLGMFHANISLVLACRAVWNCGLTFGEPNNDYTNLTIAHS
eukprot:CAMPEP_0115007536 /NCGR_PEP_ID=MMETSP0216-20121206/21260_1 /TAXON_ID=223996 /ORGANISM="Protocruzia adherens, Strain Boccale" /LENGTH=99 /DNA_ID=CAMNT_0002374541 /DNA_START=99 /DNA_END=395 /DNA_ORIENTATION=+